MSILVKIVIIFISSIILIKTYIKASGSLSLNRLNLNSILFYYSLFYFMIGGSIIFLGFNDHYLIEKVKDEYIIRTYFIMLYALIALPVTIIFVNRIMNIKKYDIFFKNYIDKKIVIDNNTNKMFILLTLLSIVSGLAIFYMFFKIGYISLFEILRGDFDLITNRVAISNQFSGNEYVRNILALGMTPYLSYIVYIYSRTSKRKKWKILFVILLFLSILCKTYNFEKSPIIIYLLFFLLIEIILGNKINMQKILKYIFLSICIILVMYYKVSGYIGPLLSLSEGPISRIFITQVSTLFLHIQTFPEYCNYLYGESFPSILAWIFSANEYGVRSGKIVMQLYNNIGIENGTAGVMNTLYIGEAYANFGIVGVLIAPIIIGLIIAVISNSILRQKKDPINVGLYIIVTNIYTTAFTGGFVDYIYNSIGFIIIIILLIIKIFINNGKIKFHV